jgi:hypothetical protein
MRVALVMAEDLELVSVVAVKAGHGAKPHKPPGVLIETGDMIVRQSVGKIECRKLIFSRLSK